MKHSICCLFISKVGYLDWLASSLIIIAHVDEGLYYTIPCMFSESY